MPLRMLLRGILPLLAILPPLTADADPLYRATEWSLYQDVADITVTGTVYDENGQPLPGVTVLQKGTSNGTVTDIDGGFTVTVPEASTLVISFIGYGSVEVEVDGRTQIDVNLDPGGVDLDEVVVVGYGTQSRETVTGAVSSVDGEEFVRSPQPNLSSSFAGRVPGVIALNRSGEPGFDDAALRIRGISTPGNNSPLVVIDGVANRLGGLNRLDPNDIESVSVLKDASAAIYGSQAANGVIIVTTKRGQTGKPTFSFTYNQGFVQPTKLPELADAPTYANILNEINYYRNPGGGFNQIYSPEEIQKFRDGSDPDNYANTDWIDEVIRPVAFQDQENLSVGGGTEKLSYYASIGRINQQSIIKNGITSYQQYSIRSNLDLNVNEYFKISFDVSGRQEDRLYPTTGASGIFRSLYRNYPTIPIRYSNGLLSPGVEDGQNPAITVTDIPGTNDNTTNVLNTMLRFEYRLPFLESVSFDGFYSQDRTFSFGKTFRTPFQVYQINNSTSPATFDELTYGTDSGGPELYQNQGNQALSTFNFRVNFDQAFGEHTVGAFLAYEQQRDQYNFFDAVRTGFLSAQIPEFNLGGGDPTQAGNSGYSNVFTRRNYFGRVTYNYSQKYLFEAQFRYDGSSRFADGNKYGFFPSLSAGWRVSEEDWFSTDGPVGYLKVRASWGLLGNDRVDPFQYLNSYRLRPTDYVSQSLQPVPIFIISQLANPDITWETAEKLDIGVEMELFRNFKLELDYFSEVRNDLLTTRQGSLPLVSGIVNELGVPSIIPQENIGIVKNRGLEGQLGYNTTINKLRLFATVNGTYNRNEVVFLDDPAGIPDYQLSAGKPLGSPLVYQTIGIFRTQADLDNFPSLAGNQLGDLIYRDVDGDGEITELDRVRLDRNNIPQFTYGASLGAQLGNFDASVLLQGQALVQQHVVAESGEVGNFFSTWADNRWSPDNPDGTYPRVDVRTGSSINGGLFYNDFWMQNTSFMRIKNAEIGYTLPAALLERINLQSVRVYANGFNLATFTGVTDIDPEGDSSSGQFYPQQKTYNLGLNVKF